LFVPEAWDQKPFTNTILFYYRLPSPPPLTGELSLNKPRILEKILEGKVVGAESIVVEKSKYRTFYFFKITFPHGRHTLHMHNGWKLPENCRWKNTKNHPIDKPTALFRHQLSYYVN
jgi:hypothetical protein